MVIRSRPRAEWIFDGPVRPTLDVDALLDLPAARGRWGQVRSASSAPADAQSSDGFSFSPRRRVGCLGTQRPIFTESTHDVDILPRRRPVT